MSRHWIVNQSKNIWLEQPKTISVRRSRLNVKIRCEKNGLHSEVFLSTDSPECWIKMFYLFSKKTFFPTSASSCDPSHWLRAQNAAFALCCGPWEGLGVGQGWHRQRDAGQVRNSFHAFISSHDSKVKRFYQVCFTSRICGNGHNWSKLKWEWFLSHVYTLSLQDPVSVCRDWPLTPD